MPPVIPPPPLPAGSDDRFHFSPGNANPELWATTTPLIVVLRCRRHKGLIATWRAIHWLIVLHSRSGRADFGVREIAEEADVGRNELCDTHDKSTGKVIKKGYISILCDAGLINIVDHVAVPGGRKPRNVYSVDLAQLIAESALLAPEVLRTYGAASPPRPRLHPDQLTFFGLLEQEAHRLMHEFGTADTPIRPSRGSVEAVQAERAVYPAAPAIAERPENMPEVLVTLPGCPENGAGQLTNRPENGTDASLNGYPLPENGTAPDAARPVFGTGADLARHLLARNRTAPQPYHYPRPENRTADDRHRPSGSETGTGTPENVTAVRSVPSRIRDVGGMDGGMDAWGDGGRAGDSAALMLSPATVREIVRAEIEQALTESLRTLAIPPSAPIRSVLDEHSEEAIPPAPAGELPVEAGPELTWAALIDRALTGAEHSKIREIIRRYAGPSQGTAAYWLVRAMNTVALDDKPLSLNYVGGVLKRLKRAGRWDSEELALAAGEFREEDGSDAPRPLPAESKRLARGKPRDPGADLPGDLREAPAIATYLRRAPAGITLAEPWAREILRRVTDLALWESQCQNWRSKYDYSNVRGLLERHEADARAIQPALVTVGGGAERPADPLAAIAQRLSLEEQERIIAIANAIEERHGLDREAWTWVLVALADGRAPEEAEREALSRFSRTAPEGKGGHR
jgi:hypothetical protein